MIRLNKYIKVSIKSLVLCSMLTTCVNLYRSYYSNFEINLNDLYKDIKFDYHDDKYENNNPFELLESFNKEEFLINRIKVALYNPPLTNKLYPKSNLYGHELIRYFDK